MDAETGQEKVMVMERPTSILERIGRQAAPPAATVEAVAAQAAEPLPFEGGALPLPGDVYQAHSLPTNRPQAMLCLVGKPPGLTCLAYADLRFVQLLPPEKPGGGPVLSLAFSGVADVLLEGRNLDRLVELLRRHCLAWVRLQLTARVSPPVEDDGAVVITAMAVKLAGR